jgi:hypothetical protein
MNNEQHWDFLEELQRGVEEEHDENELNSFSYQRESSTTRNGQYGNRQQPYQSNNSNSLG